LRAVVFDLVIDKIGFRSCSRTRAFFEDNSFPGSGKILIVSEKDAPEDEQGVEKGFHQEQYSVRFLRGGNGRPQEVASVL
jgi:hypothetical protein